MRILSDDDLEKSAVVVNSRMNRERNLTSSNGDTKESGFHPKAVRNGSKSSASIWLGCPQTLTGLVGVAKEEGLSCTGNRPRDTEDYPEMDATFRQKRKLLYLLVGCLLCYLTWSGLFACLALTAPKVKYRLEMAVLSAGLPLSMAGVTAWLVVGYWRNELTIRGEWVTFRGVLRRRN